MTEKEFVYWLQGHFEMNPDNNVLTEDQVKMIRQHLQLVFTKVTNVIVQGSGDKINITPAPFLPQQTPTIPIGPWHGIYPPFPSYPYYQTICSAIQSDSTQYNPCTGAGSSLTPESLLQQQNLVAAGAKC